MRRRLHIRRGLLLIRVQHVINDVSRHLIPNCRADHSYAFTPTLITETEGPETARYANLSAPRLTPGELQCRDRSGIMGARALRSGSKPTGPPTCPETIALDVTHSENRITV